MLDNILGIDSGMDASKPAAPVSAATTIDYKSVWKSISTHDDEDGRIVSELFQELPDADEYPDYYEEVKEGSDNFTTHPDRFNSKPPLSLPRSQIKQPIALDSIKKKISKNEYHDLAAFEADFNLMFSNAKQYNAEGSSVYTDAVTLQVKQF